MADNQYIANIARDKGLDISKLPGDPATCWVMKALDPASEACGPLTGIPDLNNEATFTIEMRQVDQVTPPTMTAGQTWDLDYVALPGPALLGVYRTRVTGSVFPSNGVSLVMNKQYTWASTQPTIPSVGPIAGGNQGRWPLDVKGYRVMYASSTGVFNGASLSDQGTIITGQVVDPYISHPIGEVAVVVATGFGRATPDKWLEASINSPVPTYDTILQTCPRAEMRRAKEGWYIPQRLTTVSANTPFQPSNDSIATMTDPWLTGSSNNLEVMPGWFPIPPVANAQMGVVSVRGLASTSTFAVHTRVGFECTLEASSNYRLFVTPSCAPEFGLIQEYARINALLGDGYPERYNSSDVLGTIITQLAGHMPAPWNKIVPILFKVTKGGVSMIRGKGKGGKGGKFGSKGPTITEVDDDGNELANGMRMLMPPQQPPKKTAKNTKPKGIPGMPKPIRRVINLAK
jgi:hypothetical protein